MITTALSRHIIDKDEELLAALKKLNDLPGPEMTLFVCDADNIIVGTLTDGDIRRALVAGAELDSPVKEVMHKSFKSVKEGVSDIEMLKE